MLRIKHYPFVKALDIRGDNVNELLPERLNFKSMAGRLNFDIINFFINRSTKYFEDIKDIYEDFPFDLMIADRAFSAIPFVKEKMNIPVVAVGIFPLAESSKDLAPYGLAITPSKSFAGSIKQAALRWVADKILFAKSTKALKNLTIEHNLSYEGQTIFDYIVKKSTLLLQSATPGFEYQRSDLGKNITFIGAVLPHSYSKNTTPWFDNRLNQYEKVVLVTQGRVEKDIEKLLVPTLEAFENTDVLVIATTGGAGTAELRERFPACNLIIEDFIPFNDVMPYADVYISNGGYGGVLLAIEHQLPLVVAGMHEGKNEICARVGYFKIGINLKTEKPETIQIRRSVVEVLNNVTYKRKVVKLAEEFSRFEPAELTAKYVDELLANKKHEIVEDVREVFY